MLCGWRLPICNHNLVSPGRTTAAPAPARAAAPAPAAARARRARPARTAASPAR